MKKSFTLKEAKDIAGQLEIDFKARGFTPEEFLEGMNIELEHGTVDPHTNVSQDNPLVTGKIALAHLNENPLYYHPHVGLHAWEHALEDMKGNPKGKKIVIS